MILLAADPMTQLAFSVSENKGMFALLLGSGISRAAGIMTGWDITKDLIQKVATAKGVEEQSDWAAWYRAEYDKDPEYSQIVEMWAKCPEERRSVLHSYIEPTDDDRQKGEKIPTKAHRAIARLVRDDYIRVIITTNFDQLMEDALRDEGVRMTVVSSEDTLEGAEALSRSKCYLFKLHGDYKDWRIRNTEKELACYPPAFNKQLDRIFDEHGLIVCGWSGEWDLALRAALLHAPNRRYPFFWSTRGEPKDAAAALIAHRDARVVPDMDADEFFTGLQQRVEALARIRRPNPLSVEVQVAEAKRFLAKPEFRIQFDDLLTDETDRVVSHLDSSAADTDELSDEEAFRIAAESHEAATEALASIAGIIGRWGHEPEQQSILDIIESLHNRAVNHLNGTIHFPALRSYPAVLVFSSYGIGLTRARRWRALRELFDLKLYSRALQPDRAVSVLLPALWATGGSEHWKYMPNNLPYRFPFEAYLAQKLGRWGRHFVGSVPDFDILFERFQMLGALSVFDQDDREKLVSTLDRNDIGWVSMPRGRFTCFSPYYDILMNELASEAFRKDLTGSGFALNDNEVIDLFIKNCHRIIHHWCR